jgi:hypothetical protein
MCVPAAASFREVPWQHELRLKDGASCFNPSVKGRGHPPMNLMKYLPLYLGDDMAGVLFVPAPVQWLGHGPELDQQVTR